MIGIDIVAIGRIEKNIQTHGKDFLKKFLSEDEIRLVQTPYGYKASGVAGFWAAKEACSKALGVGISDKLRFFDMCLSKSLQNAPLIKLQEDKMSFFNIDSISLSISHDGGFAIAVVIIKIREN
ncbi:holo-ACP synthase [Helicobacter sp. 11S03491-1]|uniref:holo-ACP synthase n=1 Tax=Helicobacter sp. 11S03491-1 TaxID=1476196 RepID=UPI000BA77670|nr:holo-ACP synthase [Helicobacter sp. 11S03491-1]PAF41231.1 holo-ACP synthase [Helicobacter sp. 11S03491-1]